MSHRILVGTDASASADRAVEAAAELAETRRAELLVLYVRPKGEGRDVLDPRKAPDPNGYLRDMPERFPGVHVRTLIREGDPAGTICDVADEEEVELIVVGNRGTHDRKRGFLRSVPTGVLRRSPTSVLIVDTRAAQ